MLPLRRVVTEAVTSADVAVIVWLDWPVWCDDENEMLLAMTGADHATPRVRARRVICGSRDCDSSTVPPRAWLV